MIKRVMLKPILVNIPWLLLFCYLPYGWSAARYGESLCHVEGYHCIKVDRSDSWGSLFPDSRQRDLVKRVNRMTVFLKPNMVIAVPDKLKAIDVTDLSPFPKTISPSTEEQLVIDIKKAAWGAYDQKGSLIKWGPASTGMERCQDSKGGCSTPLGQFRVMHKHGADCVSSSFPKRIDGMDGGAEMPYCIYFQNGYAIHGSRDMNGLPSSHGCVNVFPDDALWLNQYFVVTPEKGKKGTLVIINE